MKRNILVLTQWSFKDALVQTYTLPYVNIIAEKLGTGEKIWLVTSEQENMLMDKKERDNVQSLLLEKNIGLITFRYSRFGLMAVIKMMLAAMRLAVVIFSKKITHIHAWGMPAGSLGYMLSILTGRTLIVDSYEPHAEAMVENGTWKKGGIKFRILFYLEKKLSRRAKYLVSATEGMREYARDRYGLISKAFFVKPACVDMEMFDLRKRKDPQLLKQFGLENKIVCVYAGKFGGIYLTGEVFRFFHFCEKKWGADFRALLLTNTGAELLDSLADENGFDKQKMIVRFVSHNEIPLFMGLADFAITPVKPVPTKKYCTPIKDGEYWALGLPVVITKNISDDSDIIAQTHTGAVIDSLNDQGFEKAVNDISQVMWHVTAEEIRSIAKEYRSFEIAQRIYSQIYAGTKTDS